MFVYKTKKIVVTLVLTCLEIRKKVTNLKQPLQWVLTWLFLVNITIQRLFMEKSCLKNHHQRVIKFGVRIGLQDCNLVQHVARRVEALSRIKWSLQQQQQQTCTTSLNWVSLIQMQWKSISAVKLFEILSKQHQKTYFQTLGMSLRGFLLSTYIFLALKLFFWSEIGDGLQAQTDQVW